MFETHYTPRITSHAVAASNIGERLLLLAYSSNCFACYAASPPLSRLQSAGPQLGRTAACGGFVGMPCSRASAFHPRFL